MLLIGTYKELDIDNNRYSFSHFTIHNSVIKSMHFS